MYKCLISCFLFLIVLYSCTQEQEVLAIPDTVLDKEKFSDLICDFTLAETAANINIKKVNGQSFDTVYAFNPLVENNISKAVFDTTLFFYSHHPTLFKEVYDLSLEKLSKMQDSRKNDKKTNKDSVK